MDKNFDFNSKKYMILLVLICVVFAILIIKAFDYLPENDAVDTNDVEIENINTPSKVKTYTKSNNDEQNQDITNKEKVYKPVQKSGVLYKSKDSLSEDTSQFDEIDAPPGAVNETVPTANIDENNSTQLSPDEYAIKFIMNARKFSNSGNLTSSLNEYKKALESTSDPELQAEAYEGISILYSKNKNYSTALSFASKAYKASPSLSRDILIAKIYYSAGKTDIAITRINQILKQGF